MEQMSMAATLRYTVGPRKLLTAIICTLALCRFCDGSLTEKPSNIEAVVGQRVQLHCSTSEPYHVLWDHASVGSTSRYYIFYNGNLILPYSQRFQLDRDNTTGAYNLVIPSVQKEDAGNYRCMDMLGHGEQAEAELIVLDSNPQCETDVIEFCEQTSQNFETTCTVGFRGNLVPEIECSSNGVMASDSIVKEKTQDSVTYNQRLTAHWPIDDGHPIVCRTSISNVSSYVNSTVTYAFGYTQTLTIDHRNTVPVNCKANSSGHCSYQWTRQDTNAVVCSSQTLTAEEAGEYTCEAKCLLRDQLCAVIPLVANLTNQGATTDTDRTIAPIAICVAVVGMTALVVVAGALVFVYIRNKRRQTGNRPRDQEATTSFLDENFSPSSSSDHERTNGNLNNVHNAPDNSHLNGNANAPCTSTNLHEHVNGNAPCTSTNSYTNANLNGNVHCASKNKHEKANGSAHCTSENSHENVNGRPNVHRTSENAHR